MKCINLKRSFYPYTIYFVIKDIAHKKKELISIKLIKGHDRIRLLICSPLVQVPLP